LSQNGLESTELQHDAGVHSQWRHPAVSDGNLHGSDLKHGWIRQEGPVVHVNDLEDLKFAARIQLQGMYCTELPSSAQLWCALEAEPLHTSLHMKHFNTVCCSLQSKS
jgi:hypothetical protein